jgi:hypothetical protein
LEKQNEKLRKDKTELESQVKENESQAYLYSSMVVETKDSKNKEIEDLNKKLAEYEEVLFKKSKENVSMG